MRGRLLVSVAGMVLMQLASIADTETVNGITWMYTVRNGSVEIGNYGTSVPAISSSIKGEVTIPSTLGGCPVMSIGSYAFRDCNGLTRVMIPSSVTSIGGLAFDRCSGLLEIDVATENRFYKSVSGMLLSNDGGMFVTCPGGLTSVVIPSGVISIESHAFYGCRGLTSVSIPSSVTAIGNNAFSGCSGLTSVSIPSSVKSIGYNAFYGCSGLMSVSIPSSVTSIGNNAFYGCRSLTGAILNR